ncbi:hypothetical protein K443DRAFT_412436 [Laccaria amethystina LaAM-08-1]|uniref:Uncharacterized protein n=1 Tax=Laccaria amethystina LaAM-08-1 TaxID=1095629 RepID=A0A0C9XSF3_9AGAR|nr:hypothetical protein K443DRAFT_412436 [Laccaria amethystina LaAM-08-1]
MEFCCGCCCCGCCCDCCWSIGLFRARFLSGGELSFRGNVSCCIRKHLFSRRRTRPLSSSLPTSLLGSTSSRLLLVPLLLLHNVRRSSGGVIKCTPRFLLIPRS